jgi:hypothetical protein
MNYCARANPEVPDLYELTGEPTFSEISDVYNQMCSPTIDHFYAFDGTSFWDLVRRRATYLLCRGLLALDCS